MLVRITNTPRSYEWGVPGGISDLLGWEPTAHKEAELWLGDHILSPSRFVDGDGADLHAWAAENAPLSYLFKVLAAAVPLSIQAHPDPQRARAGFADEEQRGVPVDARHRNYKDPHAKPEMILALEDGFEALCGIAPVAAIVGTIDRLMDAEQTDAVARDGLRLWREMVAEGRLDEAFRWALSDDSAARAAAASLTRAGMQDAESFPLLATIGRHFPDDAGLLVASMMNHLTLRAGEALWVAAGVLHAYQAGRAVEIMGPSDNVLRGGLTPKHIDVAELSAVVDLTPGEPPRLLPVAVGPHVNLYRPPAPLDEVGFELAEVTGDAELSLDGPAIALCLQGRFDASSEGDSLPLESGQIAFATDSVLRLRGEGRMFVALTRGAAR
ncbi:mannose-6-phosphate isomerase, class I [Microbacterium aurum]